MLHFTTLKIKPAATAPTLVQNGAEAILAAKDETIALLKDQIRSLEDRIGTLESNYREQLGQLVKRFLNE